jgi:aryl sulfotransferase
MEVNGRWLDELTGAKSAEYQGRAATELGLDCARWLATGEGITWGIESLP